MDEAAGYVDEDETSLAEDAGLSDEEAQWWSPRRRRAPLRRRAPPPPPPPPPRVNCVWGPWGSYTKCSKTCGGGRQKKSRSVSTRQKNGGSPCWGLSRKSRTCNKKACPTTSTTTTSTTTTSTTTLTATAKSKSG